MSALPARMQDVHVTKVTGIIGGIIAVIALFSFIRKLVK